MNIFCLNLVCYKSLSKYGMEKGLHPVDICFYRTFCLFLLAAVTAFIKKKHVLNEVKKGQRMIVLIRSIVGLIGFTSLLLGLQHLPIYVTTILMNTAPFWVTILSYFILKSKVTTKDLLLIVGCFSGVVILSIGQKMGDDNQENIEEDSGIKNRLFGVGCIFVLSWCYSTISVINRFLKDTHFSVLLFHYGWIASVILLTW